MYGIVADFCIKQYYLQRNRAKAGLLRLFKIAAMAAVFVLCSAEVYAQRQEGFVGGRYFGYAAARPLHTQTLPGTGTVNVNTANTGLMISPGTIVQRQCATPTSGAIFELVGFAIGTPTPNIGSPFTGTFCYVTNAATTQGHANTWRRLVDYDQVLPVPAGQTAGYNLAEGMLWLVVNWGEGVNARYELKLNSQWQLVPRYGIFFQYEIN